MKCMSQSYTGNVLGKSELKEIRERGNDYRATSDVQGVLSLSSSGSGAANPQYRIPEADRDECKRKINRLLEDDIIEPSDSSF